MSTFAPFTALVALQATVYRSVHDCVQYLAAMAAGAALAGSLAAAAEIHGWVDGKPVWYRLHGSKGWVSARYVHNLQPVRPC
ncbi:hypothetical protein ACFYYB_27820 [Streptomyces sp. NPDC002886]|uniref:hypothetical protein n=1 Tax=Streptomyces sp. NPDC002886 TaxID=3364667 RepID=UPI0036A82581